MGVMKKNWDSKICRHVFLPTNEKSITSRFMPEEVQLPE
jgi:hypothetical protein